MRKPPATKVYDSLTEEGKNIREDRTKYKKLFISIQQAFELLLVMDATNKESQNTATKPTKADAYAYDYVDYSAVTGAAWDPLRSADWDMQTPTMTCIARIKK